MADQTNEQQNESPRDEDRNEHLEAHADRRRQAGDETDERAEDGTGELEGDGERDDAEHDDTTEPVGDEAIESAALVSFEALEGEADAPILPVRPIDDDEDAEDDDAADEDAESDDEAEGDEAELAEMDGVSEDSEAAGETDEDEPSDRDGEGSEGASGAGGDRKRRRRRGGRGRKRETQQTAADTSRRRHLMVVNDSPGEECRIAILENGRLEQVFAERETTATNVGNIYKGKVVNVEAAIQAAFIDFGEGQNGFLHISDLHPRYFPGQERTETVGRKIPRRDRPPIQEALRRGQEVIVQVLKEGIGTKGPTLTSYISIPGRLLVMMPHMDRVGVSRKVEDEDQRREMRRIIDSLELPEGCGFILRTAGFDRSKTELQRDALYLQRLWEAMERRMATTGAPCTLYTESDLLVRTIRDVVDDSVEAIVVDSESAFNRARTFLHVVAPLNAPRLCFYDRHAPIFYAFGVEQQIEQIHSRKVPLPSGGALVIDQTEAMVAIDVNSGKSRSARDSETNAYNTNKEAVDEIARQLRLRDLGGIIVNDLIDMRSSRHRREIEERLQQSLRHDRAKTTTLEISDFGIIEMTRQRMRPGLHKALFMDCPHCHGSGEVRVPDAVAADCIRKAALLFCYDRVHRVEIVCSVRAASALLSARRQALYELEDRTGKRVDVRISETFGIDRVDIYAYDERGADVEVDRLPRVPQPRLDELPAEPVMLDEDEGDDDVGESGGRRRRRRRRKPAPADATAMALAGGFDDLPTPSADEPSVSELIRRADVERQARKAAEAAARTQAAADRAAAGEPEPEGSEDGSETAGGDREGRSSRGGRRTRRGRGRREAGESTESIEPTSDESRTPAGEGGEAGESATEDDAGTGEGGGRKRRRRRRRGRGGKGGEGRAGEGAASGEPSSAPDAEGGEGARGGEGGEGAGESRGDSTSEGGNGGPEGDRPAKKRRRRRGGRGRGRRGDGEGAAGGDGAASGATREAGAGEPRAEREPRTEREPRRERESASARSASNGTSAGSAEPKPTEESATKRTIRSVTGWMRRLKGPAAGPRDDR